MKANKIILSGHKADVLDGGKALGRNLKSDLDDKKAAAVRRCGGRAFQTEATIKRKAQVGYVPRSEKTTWLERSE